MSYARAYYHLISYGDAIYALGGHTASSEINAMERYTKNSGWQAMAALPYNNHRFVWHIEWEQISRELIMFAGKSRSGKKNWTQQFFILISMKTFPIISVHLFLLDTVQYLMNWMITSIWLEEEIMLIRHINIKYQQIHGGQCMIHLLTTVFM